MSDNIKQSITAMLDEMVDDYDDAQAYESETSAGRHDVRRKIEDLLERKRLREELGDLELDW